MGVTASGDVPLVAPVAEDASASGVSRAERPLLLVTTVAISGDLNDRIELHMGDCPRVPCLEHLTFMPRCTLSSNEQGVRKHLQQPASSMLGSMPWCNLGLLIARRLA